MFKIYFINNTTITEDKCKWDDLPKIPVVQIDYDLGNNKIVRLAGFEKYIVFKEFHKFPLGGPKEDVLSTINILGKHKENVYQFSMNVIKRKALQRKGIWGKEFASLNFNTLLQKFEFGKERPSNHDLWIDGVSSLKPTTMLI